MKPQESKAEVHYEVVHPDSKNDLTQHKRWGVFRDYI